MIQNEDLGGMDGLAGKSAEATDAALAEKELQVLTKTSTKLNSLRPQIEDQASFDKLLTAVRESTTRNESAAELGARLKQLGIGVLKVAVKVAQLAAKGIV